jgi:hypothetical protein
MDWTEGGRMINYETVGTMLLFLSVGGETESLNWTDFEQAMNLWVDQKSHRVDALISQALDDMWRRING